MRGSVSRFVDLSHPLYDGMPVYPGIPPPRFGAILTHEESHGRYDGRAEFRLGDAYLPGNTGTYVDAPWHRYRDGSDLASLPLESLVGLHGVVVDASWSDSSRAVTPVLGDRNLQGAAVLVRTGWDARWGSDSYWTDGPHLSADAVSALIAGGVALVGVDCANVDDIADPSRPAHTRLLGASIPIVEHLCSLEHLVGQTFRLFVPVLAIRAGASFPVRVFAEVTAE